MTGDGSALHMVLTGDPGLFAIVRLSLVVSLSAVLFAALIGVPIGAFLALTRFRGREGAIVTLNAMMGLPPVVVGLGDIPGCCRARARSDHGACCSRRRPW